MTDEAVSQRHARFGWWSLVAFGTLGLALEALHLFKAPVYMDAANETRRLMWTLAHAHGTLLSLVHILFGLSACVLPGLGARRLRLISGGLIGATLLLPGGFFLGGVIVHGGDPGLGIILVPAGAILLIAAAFLMARGSAVDNSPADNDTDSHGGPQ